MALFVWTGKKRKKEEHRKENMINTESLEKEITCPKCKNTFTRGNLLETYFVCPQCGNNLQMGAQDRINMIVDAGTFEIWFEHLSHSNPLDDEKYMDKVSNARENTGISEAVVVGKGKLSGEDIVIGVCDARFLMGSMGYVVGERITLAFEKATELKLPVFMFCCSGGARMQEGIVSLMQMKKTSAAVKRHSDAGLFYCSILTDPTMGGVTASFATLADVILAEPGARIGFAGRRVIQQTIKQDLPEGFQTAEFLLEHGMIDRIVERKEMKHILQELLFMHRPITPLSYWKRLRSILFPEKYERTPNGSVEILDEKTAWEKVKMCRNINRLSSMDYIENIFSGFIELHGDRYYADDRALIGGIAFIENRPVTILGGMRGKTLQECVKTNFGMAMPEGYRKAVRLMKQAEKFNRPIISFVNTPGAFCGVEAEQRGQGEAIARSIMEMAGVKVPVLCILIGEGGSGGALATAVGNEVWMMEHSVYSILSPEGYASILWKTGERAEEAAEVMKITAQDLLKMKIIDKIIPEFGGATQENQIKIFPYLKENILEFLRVYGNMNGNDVVDDRYRRFRDF